MDYYEYFNDQIGKQIDAERLHKDSKVVLYPFGKQGMLVKQILNWRYGINELFICDNGLSRKNTSIKPLKYLGEIDTSQIQVIITSDNRTYWDDIRMNLKKYIDEKNIIDLFSCKPLMNCSPRIASLEVAAREIYDKGIGGAVAEAGVYQGGFASYINRFFNDRKLYLFDTFEGFSARDIEVERKKDYSLRNAGHFGDTSVEQVISNMPFKDNVIVKKGYFPDTADGLDEKYCFVSLDLDLYQPIKAGLEYFYPNLVGGGYIFIHDCNIGHINYSGARAALLEFVEKIKVGYVMLPDNRTAVIAKQIS